MILLIEIFSTVLLYCFARVIGNWRCVHNVQRAGECTNTRTHTCTHKHARTRPQWYLSRASSVAGLWLLDSSILPCVRDRLPFPPRNFNKIMSLSLPLALCVCVCVCVCVYFSPLLTVYIYIHMASTAPVFFFVFFIVLRVAERLRQSMFRRIVASANFRALSSVFWEQALGE